MHSTGDVALLIAWEEVEEPLMWEIMSLFHVDCILSETN